MIYESSSSDLVMDEGLVVNGGRVFVVVVAVTTVEILGKWNQKRTQYCILKRIFTSGGRVY